MSREACLSFLSHCLSFLLLKLTSSQVVELIFFNCCSASSLVCKQFNSDIQINIFFSKQMSLCFLSFVRRIKCPLSMLSSVAPKLQDCKRRLSHISHWSTNSVRP